jgi:hypothetical protein
VDTFCNSITGQDLVHIVAVNAEGDLFGTSIRLRASSPDLFPGMEWEEGEEETRRETKVDSLLECWGRQVVQAAQLKQVSVRSVCEMQPLPSTHFLNEKIRAEKIAKK